MPDRKLKHSNRPIRKATKEVLEPAIANLGFEGKYPNFQRDRDGELHFIQIATTKYGGGISLAGGWMKRPKGQPESKLSIATTDFDDRAAITQPTDCWNVDGTRLDYRPKVFDYRFMLDDEQACAALVEQMVACLPALEKWFQTKALSDELAPVFDKFGSAPNANLNWKIAQAKAQMGLY